MIVDTNVLIRLERETRKGIVGEATRFLQSVPETRICITPTVAGEIACGASMSDRGSWERFLKPFECVPIDEEAMWIYGFHYRELAARGRLIDANDLWIAATALAHGMPVATGNVEEFRRVRGLTVIPV